MRRARNVRPLFVPRWIPRPSCGKSWLQVPQSPATQKRNCFFRYCSISEHSVFGDRSHMGHRAISCCSGNDPSRPTGAIPAAPARPRGLPATREAAGRGGPATIANSGPRPHLLNLARAVTRGREEEEAVVPAHGHCSTHAQCFFFFPKQTALHVEHRILLAAFPGVMGLHPTALPAKLAGKNKKKRKASPSLGTVHCFVS